MGALHRRAEAGIGVLIIIIALIFSAVVAVAVLFGTGASFQEESLEVASQAKGQIATCLQIVEVSATDGVDGDLEEVIMLAKVGSASGPMKLNQSLLSVSTHDKTSSLNYRSAGSFENDFSSGYFTYRQVIVSGTVDASTNLSLGVDFDHDGQTDHLMMNASTNALVYVFNASPLMTDNFRVLGTCDAAGSLTQGLGASLGYIDSIEQSGSFCTSEDTFFADDDNVLTIIPVDEGDGWFTVEYVYRGPNPIDDTVQQGDIIRLYFAAPRQILENEHMRINFIPKRGTASLVEVIAPEVIAKDKIYLYP